MRTTFGSVAFRLFDKVIVVILVLLALSYVAAVIIKKPDVVFREEMVERLKAKVRDAQEKSEHKRRQLTTDYISETVGSFRPDLAGFEPRMYVMGGKPDTPPTPELDRISMEIKKEQPPPSAEKTYEKYANAEVSVDAGKIVTVEVLKKAPLVLRFVALEKGETKVRLLKDGKEVAYISVRVWSIIPVVPTIFPPRMAAKQRQGQVELTWAGSRTIKATVLKYRIYKGESAKDIEPYLHVAVPEKIDPEKGLPAVRIADGKPAGTVKVKGSTFAFDDADVGGGVRYWYAIDATGQDSEQKQPLASARSGIVSIEVTEAFKISFFTLAPDFVAIVVSVFHDPGDGEPGQDVEYVFRRGVTRGQFVGWKMTQVRVPGRKEALKDVDFSTGYQILDIVNGERRIQALQGPKDADGAVVKREREEKRQKLLLINERGRIKVLWPSVHGQK
ncbi:MAG: hypothetical protein ABIF82_02970 [Planctomycetota bacterium]